MTHLLTLLTGLGIWMAAAVGLGLMLGHAMHGYAVADPAAPAPLKDADNPGFRQAA